MRIPTWCVRSVPEQIAEVRETHPNHIALSYGGRRLTFEELDIGGDRFAAYLAQIGVTPGGTVAICLERSFDWVVAALGIMRAGAAYVPLDLSWPDSRLRLAAEDSGASVVVARAEVLDRLQMKAHGVDPFRDAVNIASSPHFERTPIPMESLAYVIYTSGSTGVPKGVEITHSNLNYLVRWHRETFNITPHDRASHVAGLGFDAAVWEVWPHLSAGATVCVAEDSVRSLPDLLQQWMLQESVTIGFVPTVLATPMLAMEWPNITKLRVLLTGGETLHSGPSVHLPFDVVNNYGLTECTVVSTSSVLKPGQQGMPSIGRPIAGTSVYLLNENGEQVPDGTIGELYVGGAGVGRGYRNLSSATERSFLLDPFAGAPGARMFRTGDRGVRRPNGEIEFHGRLDRQTKVRGQRVDLDEISSILNNHPQIDFATANVCPHDGENQLVAYVLPKSGRVPTAHELHTFLMVHLPSFMVPAVFMRLHTPPLSPNGKIDLNMLASSTELDLIEGISTSGSDSAVSGQVLNIVRELLENDAVRAEDSFFLAGGHSLLGMQLLIRLRKAFGLDLTLRQIFEAPTAETLGMLIEAMLDEERLKFIWSDLLKRENIAPNDNFFALGGNTSLIAVLQERIDLEFGIKVQSNELIRNQTVREQAQLTRKRMRVTSGLPPGVLALQPHGTRNGFFWVHYLSVDLAKAMGDDQPFFSVTLTEEDCSALGEKPSLQRIAACLLRKILVTQPTGPYVIGGLCLGGILAYEIATQLRAAGREVRLLVLVDSPNPSFISSCDSLKQKVAYLQYAVQRAAQLGPGTTLVYIHERLLKLTGKRMKFPGTDAKRAQDISEAAVFTYQPHKYEGKVLLLLASERPPHKDFLPGWKTVVPGNLHIRYLNTHHRELLKGENLRNIANAIASHITPATQNRSLSCCAGAE